MLKLSSFEDPPFRSLLERDPCKARTNLRRERVEMAPIVACRTFLMFCVFLSVRGWGQGRRRLRRWAGGSVLIENGGGGGGFPKRKHGGEKGAGGMSVGRGGVILFGGAKPPMRGRGAKGRSRGMLPCCRRGGVAGGGGVKNRLIWQFGEL